MMESGKAAMAVAADTVAQQAAQDNRHNVGAEPVTLVHERANYHI